jgi:hypothetical protein
MQFRVADLKYFFNFGSLGIQIMITTAPVGLPLAVVLVLVYSVKKVG